MTRSPVLNALIAMLYIVSVVGLLQLAQLFLRNEPETFLIPIAMLGLFVLSAAVMATSFFYMPLMLYLAGEKEKATAFAFKTIGIFGIVTACMIAGIFLPIVL